MGPTMKTRLLVLGIALLSLTRLSSVAAAGTRWLETHSWKGMGTKQTEKFWVNGGKWRIRYRPHGKGIFQVAVYAENGEFLDMAADMEKPVGGWTTMHGRGARHLAITGMNTTWEVSIEQRLSTIEEWQLIQIMNQARPTFVKLGTWTGEDAETKHEFAVPQGSWKVKHSSSGEGTLQIFIHDEDDIVVLALNSDSPGEDTSWVHRKGKFTMEVKAVKAAWQVDVFHEQRK